MSLTFLAAPLLMLSGVALAPVIIHLMMRAKPRRIVFPAMRFLLLNERRTQRSWRLRHLLLLKLLVGLLPLPMLGRAGRRAELLLWNALCVATAHGFRQCR